MKKKELQLETQVDVSVDKKFYFRLLKTERNLYQVEEVTIINGEVVSSKADEAAYLPIAFDKLRRKTAESFFNAVSEGAK